jgi:hypothetical protein
MEKKYHVFILLLLLLFFLLFLSCRSCRGCFNCGRGRGDSECFGIGKEFLRLSRKSRSSFRRMNRYNEAMSEKKAR